jgi:hypothetical protein
MSIQNCKLKTNTMMKNKRNLSLNYLLHLHDIHLDFITCKRNIKQKETESVLGLVTLRLWQFILPFASLSANDQV